MEKRILKLVLELLNREKQRISVAANLYDVHGLDWSNNVVASKRRKLVLEAIEVVENELKLCQR